MPDTCSHIILIIPRAQSRSQFLRRIKSVNRLQTLVTIGALSKYLDESKCNNARELGLMNRFVRALGHGNLCLAAVRFVHYQSLMENTMRSFWSLIVTLLFATACTVNPVTGEREFTVLSPQQEIAMGEQNYQPYQQSQGGPYAVDPNLSAYVNQVGQKLARVSDNPSLPYEFVVLNNDVPNAWALPGGKIALNRGLLIHLDDEAQLAAVLGHEIVHAAARHSAQQMTQGALLGLGVAVLGGVSQGSEYGGLINQGAGIGAAAWQARYGRDKELQADEFGMNYMTKAGYDPQAAVELQQTFVRLSEGRQTDFISGLFASHPPSQARVEANKRHAQSLTGNTRNRAAYQQAVSQLTQDKEAYTLHEQAIKTANDKNYAEALNLVDKAIAIQDRENHFWETKGRLQAVQENFDGAAVSFGRAIDVNRQYFLPFMLRGSVYMQQEKYSQAESDLSRGHQLLPTQEGSFMLGRVSLRLNKRQEAIQYFRAAAQGGGEVGQAATQELQQLGAL